MPTRFARAHTTPGSAAQFSALILLLATAPLGAGCARKADAPAAQLARSPKFEVPAGAVRQARIAIDAVARRSGDRGPVAGAPVFARYRARSPAGAVALFEIGVTSSAGELPPFELGDGEEVAVEAPGYATASIAIVGDEIIVKSPSGGFDTAGATVHVVSPSTVARIPKSGPARIVVPLERLESSTKLFTLPLPGHP